MEIYIDGQQLHINKGDAVINWGNLRFSEAVPDEWSTEIELANDPHNISLLGAYGLFDRGVLFNKRVICAVRMNEIARDGYLQVLSIGEYVIKVRLFINVIPYALLDRKVCEYYPHNDTVFRWDRYSPISDNIAGTDVGIFRYDYTATDFYSNIFAQWHSSVSVQSILSLIQDDEDVTLPAVDNTLYELSARKVLCPSNPYQVMMGNLLHGDVITDKSLELSGGQHITNDFKSSWTYSNFVWNYDYSDWMLESTNEKWLTESSTMNKLTYNRHCVAHIKVYACASQIGGILIPQKNNTNLLPAAAAAVPVLTSYNWDIDDILLYDDYVEFEDGDEFRLHYSGSAQSPKRNVRYTVVIEYDDYEWGDDDYDTDLVYIPAPFGIWGIIKLNNDFAYDFVYDIDGDGDGTHSATDYSFTYFGAYSNLDREMTVRELLTNLCWIHNQKMHLDRNELIFQSANQRKDITANITQVEPATDKLGQTNKISYRDAENPLQFNIDNEFLDDEVILHENSFYTADVIPQYSYTMTYSDKNSSGNQWITEVDVKFEDMSPVLVSANYEGSVYWMRKAPDIAGLGLPDLDSATIITARTLDDVRNDDYVYINGHKYMVIDGNTDLNTFVTEFTAIQMYSDGTPYEPTLDVFITGHQALTDTSVGLKIQITES